MLYVFPSFHLWESQGNQKKIKLTNLVRKSFLVGNVNSKEDDWIIFLR